LAVFGDIFHCCTGVLGLGGSSMAVVRREE
jgi:hypothetical protein